MFGASTKDCNSVFGQNTSSRAESDLNADAAAAVTAVTSTPIAIARRIRTQRRRIDLTRHKISDRARGRERVLP